MLEIRRKRFLTEKEIHLMNKNEMNEIGRKSIYETR